MGSSAEQTLHHDPKVFEERAIEQLRSKGFRITMPRLQVIRVLANSYHALSAYSIHERIIAGDGRIDVVSVYRILATLKDVDMIHHIGVVDGYLACRMDGEHTRQTEHAICSRCGNVLEAEVPDEALAATCKQLMKLGFKPEVTKIEVIGKCASCQCAAT